MKVTTGIFVVAASAALLSACAQVETSKPTAQMEPAEKTMHPVGTTLVVNDMGEQVTWEKVATNDKGSVWQGSNGCRYTQTNSNTFAPTVKFENCNGNTGTQEIQSKSGSLFPLDVGNTASWKFTGQDQQYNWTGARRCEVQEEVRLTVPAGTYDAYKVSCRDDWSARTYYYAPEVAANAAFTRVHKERGKVADSRLVKAPSQPSS
ncbi:hypothetical protein [Rhodovibrio sodomensis]|uniref:hypothetical protein n=1 Tax=Rhodovibrio sodomensis TaxID=1088 RepID=UPI0019032093|nr:hypothetical protein [Rhodovibrio sodomensis]